MTPVYAELIQIEKLINGESFLWAVPGETLEITLWINNSGNGTITNLSVTDSFPLKQSNAGLSYAGNSDPSPDATAGGIDDEGWIAYHVTWWNLTQFEPLEPGRSLRITFDVTVDDLAYGEYENCATVTAWHNVAGEFFNKSGPVNATACATVFVPATLSWTYWFELPNVSLLNNPLQRKKALSEKIGEVRMMILAGDYKEAIDKLEHDIRAKADGSLGGNPKNDWIKDPNVQKEICTDIDELITHLKTLL